MKERSKPVGRVLVLGAYGLIGSSIASHLAQKGVEVIGLGRNAGTAKKVLPDLAFHFADITQLTRKSDWDEFLEDVSVVVNCAGALQDSNSVDLDKLHHKAIAALAGACQSKDIRLVQISSVGAQEDASTEFLSSKGRGDAAVRKLLGDYVILRPALVLGQKSFGGSSLLRMLAAIPFIQPIVLPDAKVQTVSNAYLAEIVLAAVNKTLPNKFEADLAAKTVHTLTEIVAEIRHWMGFEAARRTVVLPKATAKLVSKLADGLAWLGWRSPLRTTATAVLEEGIVAEPYDFGRYGIENAAPLSVTLKTFRIGSAERLEARMNLLMPIVISVLSVFWVVSGLIGLFRAEYASQTLTGVGWSKDLAVVSVVFWAIVDLLIGFGFAFRRYVRAACLASTFVCLTYLAMSSIFVPNLWLDPLGPLVKILPVIALSLVARAMIEER